MSRPPNPPSVSLPISIRIAEYNSDYIDASIEEYISKELIKILQPQITPLDSEIKMEELRKKITQLVNSTKFLVLAKPCNNSGGVITGTQEM